MASKKVTMKKRPQRATSNVFAMFDQNQIQEFKEAFNMIDQDRDGFITKEDLADMYASLGKTVTDQQLIEMLNEANTTTNDASSSSCQQLNFTMFLTLFGVKMSGTDSEDVIRNAFTAFIDDSSSNNNTLINEDKFKELICSIGDRYTQQEADELFNNNYHDLKLNKDGMFDYIEFTRLMKNGKKE